jgi:hypothetical protein
MPVLRRQMEVYAGLTEYTDHHVGRLLDGLKKLGLLEDTLVCYIIGDNGASAEGTLNAAYNEMANFNGLAALETPEFLMERLDKLDGPDPVPRRRTCVSIEQCRGTCSARHRSGQKVLDVLRIRSWGAACCRHVRPHRHGQDERH